MVATQWFNQVIGIAPEYKAGNDIKRMKKNAYSNNRVKCSSGKEKAI
jgi:hypothetical protein